MIKPKPFKYVCSCGYKRIVNIKSDQLDGIDMLNLNPTCPKCGEEMKKKELTKLEFMSATFVLPPKDRIK